MAVVGVDIGGSTIKAAPVDLVEGRLVCDLAEHETPSPAPPDTLARAVGELVVPMLDGHDGPVGCTFPGRIRAGTSLTAVNLDEAWIGERPGDHFEARTGRTFHVVNDADAAGVAEMTFGAGTGRGGVVLMVTLGTGIGTSLFVDGTLAPNTELGDIDVGGQPACDLASRAAREERGQTWEQWAEGVSAFLQRLQDLVDPDLIIIGGGVSETPERLLPALRQPTEVVPAALGNAAGVIGAALLASLPGAADGVARRA
ncbi:MAG TPA: ROK family protein [Acidimicrobiales bacterium]